jgi:uracil permease
MTKPVLVYDLHEKPTYLRWLLLSLQHVLAMFGATVLVPALTGLDVGVTLIGAGIGTLIYIFVTKGKSPVFLGSSFAYISPILSAMILGTGLDAAGRNQFVNGQYNSFQLKLTDLGLTSSDLNFIAVSIGLMSVGILYLIVSGIIRLVGMKWLNKILPPIVIGPTIIVIGLSLAPTAVGMAQGDGTWKPLVVALITLMTAIFVSAYTKGLLQIIPIMSGIVIGYIVSILFGIVDFTPIQEAAWIQLPKVVWFKEGAYDVFQAGQIISILSLMIPVALVTISEHIGDHLVLSQIIGKDLTKKPGLSKTIAGDGLATIVAGFLGGPANTTYGENTGVVGMTKVASVWVIGGAAVIAMGLGFIGKFTALISTIPGSVMGGISMMLFGIIASSGLRVLLNNKVDYSKQRNLIITAVILVAGIGGLTVSIGNFVLAKQALAIIIGIILHQILPDKDAGYGEERDIINHILIDDEVLE